MRIRAAIYIFATIAAGCRPRHGGVRQGDVSLIASLSEPGGSLDDFAQREAWIDTYGSFPAKCINNSDPYNLTAVIFHGCYDWHSDVHGHWALLRMDLAGSGTKRELADLADANFTLNNLSGVKANLDVPNTTFELPYGRAWFLRLVTEHGLWAHKRNVDNPDRMRALGDWVAGGLMTHYATTIPSPNSVNYANDPWVVVQLLKYFQATGDSANIALVQKLIHDNFTTASVTWAASDDADPMVFFSTYWSWVYLLANALPAQDLVVRIPPEQIPNDALVPLPDPGPAANDVHHLGINWSRAWAIKAYTRKVIEARGAEDPQAVRLVQAYLAHVLAGRARHFEYRGNYYAYDHWVPQFAIYAITD